MTWMRKARNCRKKPQKPAQNLQKTAKKCKSATLFPPPAEAYSEKTAPALSPGPVTSQKSPKIAKIYPRKFAPKSYPQSPAFVSMSARPPAWDATRQKKRVGERDVSRILFPPSPKRRQTRPFIWVGPLPADSSGQPGAQTVRAAPSPPIWPCSRWGLPCPPCHHEGGALLPHRFTLACGPLVASPSAV